MNRKLYVILGSVVVAGVIGFVALRGGYPPKSNVEGAIGGANRYESAQISSNDVVLKDPDVLAAVAEFVAPTPSAQWVRSAS